jgi:hypothetical protein
MGSRGNKSQRQNQHVRQLSMKIKKFKAKGKDVTGLEKELDYMLGDDRPKFKTGREADIRLRKYNQV